MEAPLRAGPSVLPVEALITCSFWLTDRELSEADRFMKSCKLGVNKSERL